MGDYYADDPLEINRDEFVKERKFYSFPNQIRETREEILPEKPNINTDNVDIDSTSPLNKLKIPSFEKHKSHIH